MGPVMYDIKYRTNLVCSDDLFELDLIDLLHRLVQNCGNRKLDHLADLLFESHLLEEFLDLGLHSLVDRDGRCLLGPIVTLTAAAGHDSRRSNTVKNCLH